MQLNQVSTTQVTYFVRPDGTQARKGDEGSQEVGFELRRFTGRDQREITDLAHRLDKRGRPATPVGEVVRAKVVRAVKSCTGLEKADGAPIVTMSPDVFDGLPAWMTDALLHEVNELNGFDEGE